MIPCYQFCGIQNPEFRSSHASSPLKLDLLTDWIWTLLFFFFKSDLNGITDLIETVKLKSYMPSIWIRLKILFLMEGPDFIFFKLCGDTVSKLGLFGATDLVCLF